MKKIPFLFISLLIAQLSSSQYKNDNVSFRTVFMEDLCKQMQANPDHILLDVRSKGEYNDTSFASSQNIGHLKNAKNIDIRELAARLKELDSYKDKPIFVYCSQSQRSRRASKLLTDSGFSKVININGGLTTFHLLKDEIKQCATRFLESNNTYIIYSPKDLCSKIGKPNTFFLDIRSDSVFLGIANDEKQNAIGKLDGTVNIPFNSLLNSLSQIPKDKNIIIIDESGSESPKAAKLLVEKGYKNVGVLFNGMEMWASMNKEDLSCKSKLLLKNRNYSMITADEFHNIALTDGQLLLIDLRKEDEFNNKSKDYWRNVGSIRNAINVPFEMLENRLPEFGKQKNKTIVLYSFSAQPEVFQAAKFLADNGFTNVNVLMGGIFNLRWRAANIKDRSHLSKWVVNIPQDNL